MERRPVRILAVESSCDDTGVAVLEDFSVRSNIIASQEIHARYGGVVPELAGRAHVVHLVPTWDAALEAAGLRAEDIDAVACTRGPGLQGSLTVGFAFAKAWAWSRSLPFVPVNHLHAHIWSHFLEPGPAPAFPFLCLLVSGGHTLLVEVRGPGQLKTVATTLDDAVGEAFDKVAKLLGLPYPGGPEVERAAAGGDPTFLSLTRTRLQDGNFSFSGLKTQVLHALQRGMAADPKFIERHRSDVCASVQAALVDVLVDRVVREVETSGIQVIALAGGVSANTALRERMLQLGALHGWQVHIPPMSYCTDNAAMVGAAARMVYPPENPSPWGLGPDPRMPF